MHHVSVSRDNAHVYPTDPVNSFDLDGQKSSSKKSWKTRAKATWKAVRGWAGSKKPLGGVNVSRILGIVSAVTGLVSAALLISGVGASAALWLGAISMGTGIASTAIGCTAKVDIWCWVGIGSVAVGFYGGVAQSAASALRLTKESVESANALGNGLGGLLGGTGTGISWKLG